MDSTFSSSCIVMLMLMTVSQYYILQKKQEEQRQRDVGSQEPRYQYRPPIPYNHLNRFTFVGMHDVLCYHFTRFMPDEVQRILPLLGLHEIRFRNRLEATPEEAFAVVLIRLSYPMRYWSMMDRFGHSRTWLSIIYNDTIIYLYRRFRKKLE